MLDAAQYFAAGLHHDISRVLFQILTEGIVRRQEEPGVEPGLDGSESGDVGLREGVVGIMHGVGTARLVAQADRGRPVVDHDLVARLGDLAGCQRGGGCRHVVNHLDALIVEHVAGDIGGKIGLVQMIRRDDLDLATEHLATEILRRHLRGRLAARSGNVGVKPGHIEDAAEFQRRFRLRQRGARRQCKRTGEGARQNPFHENPPLIFLPPCRRLYVDAIMPHGLWRSKPRTAATPIRAAR